MDENKEVFTPETAGEETPKVVRTTSEALFPAVCRALQLGICAPAIAACVCPQRFWAVTLELIGAALIAGGLTVLLGAHLPPKWKTGLTAGVYALFALFFVWIHAGAAASASHALSPAAAAFAAMAIAALAAFALDAANARIDLYAKGSPWMTLPARIAAAAIPALALLAVCAKL